jgi:iron complex outermembrane recepter protein
MPRISLELPLAALLALGTAPVALAQTAAPVDKSQIEVITVTAEKRSENLKDVPESISVLSQTQLENEHVQDITDLTRAAPSISFTEQGGAGLGNLEIRGISSTAGASTVGVYLDDVSMSVRNLQTLGQPEPKFFDIGSIEVLRGPQGTLYGAGSEGGTIRFISNPVDMANYGGSIYSELSATDHTGGSANYNFNGVINIPIIPDKLALRLGAATITDAGYIDHYAPPTGYPADPATGAFLQNGTNTDRTNVFRAALKAIPADGLTITASLFDQRLKADNTDVSVLGQGLPLWSENKFVEETDSDVLIVPSLTVNYDLGWGDVTSISSYLYRRLDRTTDGTGENSVFFGGLLDGDNVTGLDGQLHGAQIAALGSPVYYNSLNAQLSEEFRLSSKPYSGTGLPITWIAGLYWSDDKVSNEDNEFIPAFNSTFTKLYGNQLLDPNSAANQALGFNGLLPNNGQVYLSDRAYDERQYSAFGEINYYITPQLRATAGLRYLFANESLVRLGDYTFVNTTAASDLQTQSPPHTHDYAATPKFALNYDLDELNSLYATASKGFRLGGPNREVPSNICATGSSSLASYGLTSAPTSYASDSLWNYELGGKFRLLDNTVSVNPSLFYIDWNRIQQDFPLNSCGFDFFDNGGEAESYGGELEIRAKITPELTLGMTSGYTHATFTQTLPNLGIEKGDAVEGVPRWSLTLDGEYMTSLTDSIDGFVRANYALTGESHGTINRTDPDYDRPSYGVLGASVGAAYGAWEFSIFGKNLTNDKKIIQQAAINTVEYGYTVRPLTIGIAANAKF